MTHLRSSVLLLIALSGCTKQEASNQSASNDGASTATSPAPRPEVVEPDLDATPPSIPADALKAAASEGKVRDLYEKAGWKGLWSAAGTAALDKAIGSRIANGLDRIDFGRVDASMSAAELDVTRTKAALAYASALANGVVDPTELHEVYTIPSNETDVASGLIQALQANRVAHYFASLAPQDDDYRRLANAYIGYARTDAEASGTKIADKDTIHVGDTDPRLPEIAKQLAANGYLPGDEVPQNNGADDKGPQYTEALAEGVKKLQADYGIKTDGVIGGDTLAVINTGPADKARVLAVALERRRWLSRTPPTTRIDVNAAAATLDYYRDGKLIDQRRVIVGQPGRETPPLRAPLYRLVANPTWTIPKSIPVSSATIRQKDMHKVNGYWVQPSGPTNALGLVKFDMKDDQQIYLHDTSDRSLFQRTQRDLSHGCVRVEDALGFAKMIAQQEGIESKWQQARQSGDQTFVDLPKPIPVRLLYRNAFVNTDGKIAFRTDPYGWNEAVAGKLGFSGGSSKKAAAKDIDLGP